jgi:flavin-dependent dehydrogenase
MKPFGQYDCCVVGGGPVGAVAARSAAQQGARMLLVEKDATPPYSDRCTGIVSPRCLKEAKFDHGVVLREIRGGGSSMPPTIAPCTYRQRIPGMRGI